MRSSILIMDSIGCELHDATRRLLPPSGVGVGLTFGEELGQHLTERLVSWFTEDLCDALFEPDDGLSARFDPFLGEVLIHPESAIDFIPLSLFALGAVVGAASAIPAFREIRREGGESQGPRRIATASAALLVFASAWSAVTSVGLQDATPQAGDVLIQTEDFEFTPIHVTTDPGSVSIAVTNHDNTRHTFTITELGVDLSLAPGTTQRATFNAEKGSYNFFCRPHPDMEGELVVG